MLGVNPRKAAVTTLLRLPEEVGTALHPHGLVSNVTLRQNLLLPLLYTHGPAGADPQRRVEQLLDALDLAGLAERRPDAAGPGACERAAVGRALARRPRLLLLEKPDALLTPRELQVVMALCRGEVEGILVTATNAGGALWSLCDVVVDLSAT